MDRSMMSLTTLPLSFLDYALESAAAHSQYVPTNKNCKLNVTVMLDSRPISQTGYVFVLNGGAVVWKSSKQSTTAQHATEAEYIAASEAAKEAVWIRKFIDELGVVPSNDYPIKMNCDNSAAIIIAKESGIQKGARHFQRKYHYVRECIKTGEIDIVKVHTDENLADPFTKALAGPKLTRHARSNGNKKEELDFVKLILAKSPVLKKVKLILREEIEKDEELQITRVLLPSPRASPLVKIVVKHGV
ncbi:hypothetical protein Tco_0396867 [Tanacetum coccineum]